MKLLPLAFFLATLSSLAARDLMPRPDNACFQPYEAFKPADSPGLCLQQGDRLAICGDSITGQKM